MYNSHITMESKPILKALPPHIKSLLNTWVIGVHKSISSTSSYSTAIPKDREYLCRLFLSPEFQSSSLTVTHSLPS